MGSLFFCVCGVSTGDKTFEKQAEHAVAINFPLSLDSENAAS